MNAALASTCAACQAELRLPFLCEACGELFRDPVGGLDAFARFGLEPSFELDLSALEQRHLQLSRRLHPDRLIGKDPRQQARALTLSSALNEAYALLQDERRRAELLLVLGGGKTAERDKRTPPAFLLEQLELREAVEEARAAGRPLDEFAARAERERRAVRDEVARLLGEPSWPSDSLREELRLQLNLWKYWLMFGEQLS